MAMGIHGRHSGSGDTRRSLDTPRGNSWQQDNASSDPWESPMPPPTTAMMPPYSVQARPPSSSASLLDPFTPAPHHAAPVVGAQGRASLGTPIGGPIQGSTELGALGSMPLLEQEPVLYSAFAGHPPGGGPSATPSPRIVPPHSASPLAQAMGTMVFRGLHNKCKACCDTLSPSHTAPRARKPHRCMGKLNPERQHIAGTAHEARPQRRSVAGCCAPRDALPNHPCTHEHAEYAATHAARQLGVPFCKYEQCRVHAAHAGTPTICSRRTPWYAPNAPTLSC